MSEVWKPVLSIEHCEASSLGNLKFKGIHKKPYCRIKRKNNKNYLGVKIAGKDYLLHRLIAIAFHGFPNDKKLECMHLDNNPLNNKSSNLKWGSHAENMAADRGNNHSHKGEKNPRSKLTRENVEEIRAAFKNKKKYHWGQIHFCKKFKINSAQIQKIIAGKSWKL